LQQDAFLLELNMLRHIDILGYSVLNEPAGHVAAEICDQLDGPQRTSCVFLNPHSVVVARHDPAFRTAVTAASAIFCDGVGLSLASQLLNRREVHRVYGYQFFKALSTELSQRRLGRVFFIGGSAADLAALEAKYRADYPGVRAIASYAPPFRAEFAPAEIADMAARVDASGADVLWIGLGSPKQEKVLHQLMQHCQVSCAAAVGAVFDFYSGKVPHAPGWIRRAGPQWLHRLVLEPRRLWRRTLISMPLFVSQVVRELALGARR
jgi:N-acetylglucosaminyldiphosphoundecaprenol N-acetyl-beta-D-mannosaminyltransferase